MSKTKETNINCAICSAPLAKKQTKFCSHACLTESKKNKTKKNCLFCNKPIKHIRTYCSNTCSTNHKLAKFKTEFDQNANNDFGPVKLKRILKDKFGNICSKCGLSTWNELPISLELEHIDGNSQNNQKDNLCLLCPNCHAQTPTYKAKNKGNGRAFRRKRYADGKSY